MDHSDAAAATRETPSAAQEALWQSHRMVAVSRLADGVAHEFNNLMQGVVAALEVTRKLIAGGRTPEVEPLIAKAIKSAQHASLLNQRAARFARARPIAPAELSINVVIADVEALMLDALSRAFRLEITLAPELWTVHCDAGQAEVAIVDMVLDARDSIANGGVITLSTRNDDAGSSRAAHIAGESVCFTVTATAGRHSEIPDSAMTSRAPADVHDRRLALDTVDRFARLYGGEIRFRREGLAKSVSELSLPRFVAG